jgi:hypothetical protein
MLSFMPLFTRLPMLTFKSIANFNCHDQHQGVALDAINPLSQRAYALMVRNSSKPSLQVGFMNVVGAIEMLGGLEYHHDNVMRLSGQLAAGAATDKTSLYHEAVAYVNRLGQFHYFARSRLVSQVVSDLSTMIPTIQKFLPFRMKHSAHRSLDSPHSETESTQILQAMSLSRAVGRMMMLKPGARDVIPDKAILDAGGLARFHQLQWQNCYITFQLFDESTNSHVNLVLEKEHPTISSEAYDLLASVILWEPG